MKTFRKKVACLGTQKRTILTYPHYHTKVFVCDWVRERERERDWENSIFVQTEREGEKEMNKLNQLSSTDWFCKYFLVWGHLVAKSLYDFCRTVLTGK